MDTAVATCGDFLENRGGAQHMAVNAAKLVALRDDPALAEAVRGCDLITADGQAVVWASRLLRDPLPERVAGIDLMYRLLALAEDRGHGVFILGAHQAVLEEAVEKLRGMHPRLQLCGYRHGYFDDDEAAAVAADVRDSGADLLLVAISSPRKEEFLARYREVMDLPLVMGVGGSIDVVAGRTRRAPRWAQRAGLEWLFRLAQEPRRLLKRYAWTNARFLWAVGAQLLTRRRRGGGGQDSALSRSQ